MRRALVASLALLPAVASADQVFTRSGGVLSGEIVERRPDSIVVDIGGGTIELPFSYVERIVPGTSPVAAFREKSKRLPPDDAEGWVALGHWARAHDLRSQGEEAFLRALAIDPGNVGAHQALGHVKVGDEWMTREESYRARGLVAFEGRWIAPDERQALLEERAAAAQQQQAELELMARVRESEARAREAEARARVAEATARIAEVDAELAELPGSSIQWVPTGLGFPGFASIGFPRGFLAGCHWNGRSTFGIKGALPLPGRGGALIASTRLAPSRLPMTSVRPGARR